MFLKSRIIWHLTKFQQEADTSREIREAMMAIISKTGLMTGAVHVAKGLNDPERGAFFLINTLGEMAINPEAPQAPLELVNELSELLATAIVKMEAKHGIFNLVILKARAIQVKLESSAYTK